MEQRSSAREGQWQWPSLQRMWACVCRRTRRERERGHTPDSVTFLDVEVTGVSGPDRAMNAPEYKTERSVGVWVRKASYSRKESLRCLGVRL